PDPDGHEPPRDGWLGDDAPPARRCLDSRDPGHRVDRPRDVGRSGEVARGWLRRLRHEAGRPAPPAGEGQRPPGAPEPVSDDTASGSAAILVVDDDEMNRDMLSRRLQRRGYTVVLAESGPQALDLAATKSFDLMLLDVMMPEMDGLEV